MKIGAAFDDATETWRRRPTNYPECCPNGSASTISKDMLLGLAIFAYFNKRLDITEQVIKHALSHWLIMGEAVSLKDKLGRCLMTPGLLATYAEISYRLGGPNRWWLRYLPQWESAGVTDYQAHLSTLHILLRKKLTGKVRKSNQQILLNRATSQPNNPLFQIAVGNVNRAETLLANETWWPADRLPTTADRHEPWLIQRDYGPDWLPAPGEAKTHSGGDFLFCYALLRGYL